MSSAASFEEAYAAICQQEGRLSERLRNLTAIIAHYGPPFDAAYGDLVDRLRETVPGAGTPGVGSELPAFLLPDQNGKLRTREEFLGAGPLVLSFNRGHWCEYCQLELRAFAKAHEDLATRGARVVSIMPERMEYTRRLSRLCNNAFPILTDMDNAYAMELDLVVWLGRDIPRLLAEVGVTLETSQGNGMGFVPVPATFVTDRRGIIRYLNIDPDFRQRADIETVMEAVEQARG